MQKHHVIYVPGIGDSRSLGQDKGIEWWRLLGVHGHYHPVGWNGDEPFEPKLKRLLAQIDSYTEAGDNVSLLGFSAGASAVLNAFAKRRDAVTSVICVSGKLNRPSGASNYFQQNPAFKESLFLLQHNLESLSEADKRRILTLNPLLDSVVPLQDAVIPGVKRWRTFSFSHVMSIAVTLTLYAPFLTLYLKRQVKKLSLAQ